MASVPRLVGGLQGELGDVVYVELPDVGSKLKQQDTFGVVESVKTASDVYSPVSGEVVETNAEAEETPAKVCSALQRLSGQLCGMRAWWQGGKCHSPRHVAATSRAASEVPVTHLPAEAVAAAGVCTCIEQRARKPPSALVQHTWMQQSASMHAGERGAT